MSMTDSCQYFSYVDMNMMKIVEIFVNIVKEYGNNKYYIDEQQNMSCIVRTQQAFANIHNHVIDGMVLDGMTNNGMILDGMTNNGMINDIGNKIKLLKLDNIRWNISHRHCIIFPNWFFSVYDHHYYICLSKKEFIKIHEFIEKFYEIITTSWINCKCDAHDKIKNRYQTLAMFGYKWHQLCINNMTDHVSVNGAQIMIDMFIEFEFEFEFGRCRFGINTALNKSFDTKNVIYIDRDTGAKLKELEDAFIPYRYQNDHFHCNDS